MGLNGGGRESQCQHTLEGWWLLIPQDVTYGCSWFQFVLWYEIWDISLASEQRESCPWCYSLRRYLISCTSCFRFYSVVMIWPLHKLPFPWDVGDPHLRLKGRRNVPFGSALHPDPPQLEDSGSSSHDKVYSQAPLGGTEEGKPSDVLVQPSDSASCFSHFSLFYLRKKKALPHLLVTTALSANPHHLT